MEPRASPEEARSSPSPPFSTPPTNHSRKRLRSPNDSLSSPSDLPMVIRRRASSPASPMASQMLDDDEDGDEEGALRDQVSVTDPAGADVSPLRELSFSPSPASPRVPTPDDELIDFHLQQSTVEPADEPSSQEYPTEWLSEDASNFALIAGTVTGLLSNVTRTLRRHRALTRRLSRDEMWRTWSPITVALDRLNSTVLDLTREYEHVEGTLITLSEDRAKMDQLIGPPCPPSPPAAQSPVPDLPAPASSPPAGLDASMWRSDPTPPPRESSPDVPPPPSLLDRIGQRISSDSAQGRSLSERLDADGDIVVLDDWPALEDHPSGALPSRDSPPVRSSLESRLRSPDPPLPSRPSSRASSAASGVSSQRGRSPSRGRPYKKPPVDWEKTVYVVFADLPPRDDVRLSPHVLRENLTTGLERTPDLREYSISTLRYTTHGNITIILNKPTRDDVVAFIHARMVSLVAQHSQIPRESVDTRPYQHRVSFGYHRVRCRKGLTDISPREAAGPLFEVEAWKGPLSNRYTKFRWGKMGPNESTCMLIVEFIDNENYTLSEQLRSIPVQFLPDSWPVSPVIMSNRPTLPQCSYCFKWGHPAKNCSVSTVFCARCGEPHMSEDHHLAARCCRDRPDKEEVRCAHPPFCRNCSGAHYANDHVCEYYRHRSDWLWLRERIPSIASQYASLCHSHSSESANASAPRASSSHTVADARSQDARGGSRGRKGGGNGGRS